MGRSDTIEDSSTALMLERLAQLEAENGKLRYNNGQLTMTCSVLRAQRDAAREQLIRVTAELVSAEAVALTTDDSQTVGQAKSLPTSLNRAMRRSQEECNAILGPAPAHAFAAAAQSPRDSFSELWDRTPLPHWLAHARDLTLIPAGEGQRRKTLEAFHPKWAADDESMMAEAVERFRRSSSFRA
jgi:hypothetical protein